MTITVLKPGALSQLQDLGRYGYQRFGVVVGGVMDEWSHRLANALLGNDEDDATLEITLTGPSLRFDQAATIAICGADLSPRVDGAGLTHGLPHGRPVRIEAGSQLRFGARASGARAYLAVAGGFDVTLVMGSRSTYARGGFGGLDGRSLRKDDVLAVRQVALAIPPPDAPPAASPAASPVALSIPPSPIIVPPVRIDPVQPIRIIAGRHWDVFTPQARRLLLEAEFTIGAASDRMGYRLQGPVLARARQVELISEAVTAGTIQVPPDGLPIVLMADRQTTGGYPKIANVASADLRVMAQMTAPQALRFVLISLADAQRIYLAREREYSHVRQVLGGQSK
ncbi:MAG: biotin-dependent carboxyltransferase [Lautropia sp.]|nr:biotin-dependent carboxyltransferase [Lautropia sp.]